MFVYSFLIGEFYIHVVLFLITGTLHNATFYKCVLCFAHDTWLDYEVDGLNLLMPFGKARIFHVLTLCDDKPRRWMNSIYATAQNDKCNYELSVHVRKQWEWVKWVQLRRDSVLRTWRMWFCCNITMFVISYLILREQLNIQNKNTVTKYLNNCTSWKIVSNRILL